MPAPSAARAQLDWSQRLLALVGGDADPELRLRAFRRALLLYSAARTWLDAIWGAAEGGIGLWVPLLATGACALAFSSRGDRQTLAIRCALVPIAIRLGTSFPLTDNHLFVEAILAVAASGRDAAIALAALRFVVVIVLFHTGLQKLLWGHYLRGDFLAFMIATGSPFGDVFALIVPDAEIERLKGLRQLSEGAGPYRVDSLLMVLVSNAVVAAELILPVGLVWRRSRTLAAGIALCMVAALQLGAREVLFFALFSTGLSLFLPRDPLPRLLPGLLLFYLLLIGVRLGLVPDGGLLRGGHL